MTKLEREILILEGRLQYAKGSGNEENIAELGLLITACTEQVKRENSEALCITCDHNQDLNCRANASNVYNEKVIGCVRYVDSRIHLCDSCKNAYPDCGNAEITFGKGIGVDNVIGCSAYEQIQI